MAIKALFWHKGQQVTTTTASQVTLAEAVGSRSWNDNDLVVASDGTGFKVAGKINEPGGILTTDTTLELDNLSPASLEKVGVSLDFDGTKSAVAANNTIHDVAINDVCFSCWAQVDTAGSGRRLISKRSGTIGYEVYLDAAALLAFVGDSSGFVFPSKTIKTDGLWHHYAVTFDRDGNAEFFEDGISLGTGDISTKQLTLTNAGTLLLGRFTADSNTLIGKMSDAKILTNGLWSDAQILYQATHPRDVSASAGTITDNWLLDENTGTTLNGKVNNLTLSDAAAWDQSAFISKNLTINPGGENQNIGHIPDASIDSTITVSSQTSIVYADEVADEIIFASSNDNVELLYGNPALINNAKYWNKLWIYSPTMHDDSKLWHEVDGSGNVLSREIGRSLGDNGMLSRAFDFAGANYAKHTSGNHNKPGLNDFCVSAFVKFSGNRSGLEYIINKGFPTETYFAVKIASGAQRVSMVFTSADDSGTPTDYDFGGTDIGDDLFHHVAVTFDRSGNAILYIDGVADGTPLNISSHTGLVAESRGLTIGARSQNVGQEQFDGEIADVKLYIGGVWTPTHVLYQKENAFDLGAGAGTITDAWFLNDNAASTVVVTQAAGIAMVTGANTDGITTTHWKMFNQIVPADQTGGHNFNLRISGAGAGANSATVYLDNGELLEVVAGDALVADKPYTLVYNTDTGVTGAAWSGLGADATEVKAGDLYIQNDEVAASTATKGSGYIPLGDPIYIA